MLFALLHWPQGVAVPMGILSLALCGLVLASRGVVWAVMGHVAWNALAVSRLTSEGSWRWAVTVPAALVLLAVGGLALLRARGSTPASRRSDDGR